MTTGFTSPLLTLRIRLVRRKRKMCIRDRLTVDAALTRSRECIYQAAMLDPHTAAELTIDEIRSICLLYTSRCV